MTGDGPLTGARHEPERIHERAADPAEAVNRPLEPKANVNDLHETDEGGGPPAADTDRVSGTTGSGQGAER